MICLVGIGLILRVQILIFEAVVMDLFGWGVVYSFEYVQSVDI
jgi:hypothetical protein